MSRHGAPPSGVSFERDVPMGVYVDDPHTRPDEAARNPHFASQGGAYEPLVTHDDHGSHGGHGGHDDHGGHGDHGHGGHHELPADMKINPDTGIVPRRCTDFKCCGFFLIFLVITMTGYMIARLRGHIGRL